MHTMFSVLASDHALCDQLFAQACTHVRSGDFLLAGRILSALAGTMERHLQAEETAVFAQYEAMLPEAAPLTAALRGEHGQIRGMLLRLATSLEEGDRLAFLKHAGTLALVLQQHNEKEEMVLYPMLERLQAVTGPARSSPDARPACAPGASEICARRPG